MNQEQPTPPFPARQAPAHTARPPGYPVELEQALSLRDGRAVFVRPIVPADELVIEREWRRADADTLYQRFFTAQPKLDARRLHSLVHVDYRLRLAVVAFSEDEQGAGIARYESSPGQNHAEIAFVVHPAWRRIGLGSALLRVLADAARARGIRQLTALCLQENRAMTEMLVRFGFELPQTSAGIATAIKIL